MATVRTPTTSTRVRLIEVAERLYAERGLNAVSSREIAAAAEQRNTSAVAYHFGTKRALIDAIYAHRLAPASEEQLRLLAGLDEQERGHDLRSLVAILVHSMTGLLGTPEEPGWFLRFVANALYVHEIAPFDLTAQEWTRGVHALRSRIDACMADLPAEVRAQRWDFLIGLLLHTLAQQEHLLQLHGEAPSGLATRDLLAAGLVDSAVALLSAPVSPATRHLLAGPAGTAATPSS